MASLKILDSSGKQKGEVAVNDALSTVSKLSVIHRAVVAEQANRRQGTQKVKTRAEVSGGGRKPYRQKKTGRARQGSIRAPHYAHGGVVFAPQPRSYEKKVNRKERRLAIQSAFAAKLNDDAIIVVDKISFSEPKTKSAVELLSKVGAADAKRVLVILPAYDEVAFKSFRNLPNVEVRTAPAAVKDGDDPVKTQGFSARDLMVAHKIVIAEDALKAIQEVWA
ncbi:MAG: 50S ribosomal protein L4 [Armatimonadetes bacterium]|nr:50S ribosomal protein L4 [Armatimonadota bacterium]NOG91846.1 50S ribosomal protein L4 [Armatimonadota bacterium]